MSRPLLVVIFILGSAASQKTSCGSDKRKYISVNDRNKYWYKKDGTQRGTADQETCTSVKTCYWDGNVMLLLLQEFFDIRQESATCIKMMYMGKFFL